MSGLTLIIELPSSHSIAGVSVRVIDCSLRSPVIQAPASDSARLRGSTLRIPQHSRRLSTPSREEEKPFSRTSDSTFRRAGDNTSIGVFLFLKRTVSLPLLSFLFHPPGSTRD